MAERDRFLDFERQTGGIPPHNGWPARDRVVQPGPYRAAVGKSGCAAVEHRIRPEFRTARGRCRDRARGMRVEDRIEHRQPALYCLIAAVRRDQKIACSGHSDVGDPDRLVLFALLFFSGSFEQFDGRRTAQRLKP